jgi:hypothetical protein
MTSGVFVGSSGAQATSTQPGDAWVTSCSQCAVTVTIRSGVAEAAAGSRRQITYADTDIVVWDCPDCSAANADVFE